MAYIETEIYKILGRHLRNSREAAGLTLSDVAEKLSITPMTIQRYEKGDRKISVEKIRVLCDLYNIDADQLMQSSIDSSTTTMKRYTTSERSKEIMNNISMEEIVNRIKERRFELGYTFQDLADLTHMSKSTLQRYESGAIKNIPLDRLEILASALQVDPEWIMGWENNTNPSSSSGSITANIATLLQDKSEDIQQEALSLLKNFLDCDTRNRGKISSYALGVAGDYQTPEEIEIQLDRLRKECIAAREKEEKENCAPTEKNSLKMVMKL